MGVIPLRPGELGAVVTYLEMTTRPLPRLIFALSIRHVGEHVARLLADHFHSLDALRAASEEELAAVPGVGPQIAASVARFFRQDETTTVLEKLARAGVKRQNVARQVSRTRVQAVELRKVRPGEVI